VKQLKWTTADAKRAKAMGWFLVLNWPTRPEWDKRIRAIENGPFKSDDEAVSAVMGAYGSIVFTLAGGDKKEILNAYTCRKAIALCCGAKKG